ncbi:DUF6574 domain-containing protein [Streptococcus oralis]|uniref:Response regulator (Homolog to RR11 Spn) n=1 Tax=Streptococcus oralis subsp. tigurinus TaxID=1077464 RepID=A0A1X1G4E5_STROR|nr:DUF6574 domain-containing protein [Streptococcus oralis]ORO41593.1 hypothetical protein B7727_07105 [Streptococcus oralis subsp. tigurinus]
MTQEWFESADLEKKSPQTKSENQPDQPETSETVETEPQASEETPVSPKELETHEEEAPEMIEETQTEEEGEGEVEGEAEEEHKQENPAKEKSILSKALESPYIPDIDPRKTARLKAEIALFWTWLLDAIQEPTTSKTTDQKHRYSVFGLLTLLSSFNLFFSIYHIKRLYYGYMISMANSSPNQLPPLDLFAGLSILVSSALFYFSIILGGFTVRRVLDQESDFTFQEAFDRYSRLFAIPLVLTALASFFALFGGLRFAGILTLLSMAIFALGNLFVISKPSKTSGLDPFYRFLLAVLLDGAILLPFFIAELALTVDYLRILTFF